MKGRYTIETGLTSLQGRNSKLNKGKPTSKPKGARASYRAPHFDTGFSLGIS